MHGDTVAVAYFCGQFHQFRLSSDLARENFVISEYNERTKCI